jgi:hypothetical protein
MCAWDSAKQAAEWLRSRGPHMAIKWLKLREELLVRSNRGMGGTRRSVSSHLCCEVWRDIARTAQMWPSQVLVARNTKFNLKLMEETSCRSARSWHVALRDGMVFLSPNRLSSFPSRTAVAVCGARLQTAVCNEQQTLKAIGATPSRFEFETFSIPASDITMLERKFGICERFQRCSG